MTEKRKYTPEELSDAENILMVLSKLPADKRAEATRVANAFIVGMETYASLEQCRA